MKTLYQSNPKLRSPIQCKLDLLPIKQKQKIDDIILLTFLIMELEREAYLKRTLKIDTKYPTQEKPTQPMALESMSPRMEGKELPAGK